MPTRLYSDSELPQLQAQLGVEFSNPHLLLQALTHESFLNEWTTDERCEFEVASNQRLEFLGDSALNFTVAEMLYRRLGDADEGTLSLARSHIVRKETLADAARGMNLGEFIVVGVGEARRGVIERDSVLEDAFEALVGAVFLDRGVDAAKAFIERTLGHEVDRVASEGVEKDPKSTLQELVQAQGYRSPRYSTVEAPGGDEGYVSKVVVAGTSVGEGYGPSKSRAEQQAAKETLEKFRDGVPSGFARVTSTSKVDGGRREEGRRRIPTGSGKPQIRLESKPRGIKLHERFSRFFEFGLRATGLSKAPVWKRSD